MAEQQSTKVAPKAAVKPAAAPAAAGDGKLLVAIRIRGIPKSEKNFDHTMNLIKLNTTNSAVVLPDSEVNRKMLRSVNHYVTWGELSDGALLAKMSKIANAQKTRSGMLVVRLSPPRGGHARKGVKKAFSTGGALGYRGAKIAALVEKMMSV